MNLGDFKIVIIWFFQDMVESNLKSNLAPLRPHCLVFWTASSLWLTGSREASHSAGVSKSTHGDAEQYTVAPFVVHPTTADVI